MLNVFAIATVEPRDDDRTWYAVKPSEMYPATIAHIQDVLKRGVRPDMVLGSYYDEAKSLPDVAWHYALIAHDEVHEPEAVEVRAQALDVSRRWFTEMLHDALGHAPMGLHILKETDWRP